MGKHTPVSVSSLPSLGFGKETEHHGVVGAQGVCTQMAGLEAFFKFLSHLNMTIQKFKKGCSQCPVIDYTGCTALNRVAPMGHHFVC